MHVFSQFVTHPQGITFQDQKQDEEVVLLLRRHFLTNVPWIATTIVLLLLPLLLPVLLPFLEGTLFTIPQRYILVFTFFYYLITVGFALTSFITWFYNIGIITTLRVVDIEFSNINYKNVSTALLKDLEDVTYTQSGFFQTFFNYGNIEVQTQARDVNLEFEAIPRPTDVSRTILDLMHRAGDEPT